MVNPSALTGIGRKKIRGLRRPLLEWRRRRDLKQRRVVLSTLPDVVTLEMTARCNLTCVTCRRYHVHEEYSEVRGVKGARAVEDVVGSSGTMEPHIFERCLALVRDASSVEITGYGEPMLNPDFHTYARRLKHRGHRLSTISNGLLLVEKNIHSLIDMRFDLISVSVDGLAPATLKAVRGVDRAVLFGNLEKLKRMKEARGLGPGDAPRLGVCFVMARFNIREMPDLVRELIPLGLRHFYAQNLEAGTAPEVLGPHLLHTDPGVREEAERILEETRKICSENGIPASITPLPTEKEGWEPEGADLDEALTRLREAAGKRVPPRRRYQPPGGGSTAGPDLRATVEKGGSRPDFREKAKLVSLSQRQERENRRCLDLFRYAFVAWNGKVLSCCLERHAVGDLNLETAETLWNGPQYRDLRRAYFEKGISSVCPGCSRIME